MSDYTEEQRALDTFFDDGCPNVQEEFPTPVVPDRPTQERKEKRTSWTWLQSPVKRIALLVVIIAIAVTPLPVQFGAPGSAGISLSAGAAS